MFCCKLKFVVDICNNWIYQKFTKQTVFLDSATKEQSPLTFNDDCCICGFELGVTKIHSASSDKTSYCDFVIKKEHRFLQNIFSKEEILSSETIYNLKNLL